MSDEKSTNIVSVDTQNIVEGGKSDIASVEARIVEAAEAHKRFRLHALRTTNASDWVSFDGKPYLTMTGISKLISLFDIRTKNVKTNVIGNDDGSYTVEIRGKMMAARLGEGWVDIVGTAESNDKFLTRGNSIVANKGDILKKAQTNFYVRGVTTLLGLSGLTWEELEKAGVVKRDQAAQVMITKSELVYDGELVEVKVKYEHHKELKDLVKKYYGYRPLFSMERKTWKIPKEAVYHPEIKKIIVQTESAEQTPQNSDGRLLLDEV